MVGERIARQVARQFGRPRGPLGRVIGRGMARGNAEFSRWVVGEVRAEPPEPALRIVELGPGPGIGLEAIVSLFPDAQVWGIDPSPEMIGQSRKRNRAAIAQGRLGLVRGDTATLAALAPVDVVMANHVLYFWPEPAVVLRQIHAALRPDGVLALGYQLRGHMPTMAQTQFPRLGHRLYDAEDDVGVLLTAAGFRLIAHRRKGPADQPHGVLTTARA
jgi:trans-aconitate methyltransferase